MSEVQRTREELLDELARRELRIQAENLEREGRLAEAAEIRLRIDGNPNETSERAGDRLPAEVSDDCLLVEWDGGWVTADDLDSAHAAAKERGIPRDEYTVSVNEIDGEVVYSG